MGHYASEMTDLRDRDDVPADARPPLTAAVERAMRQGRDLHEALTMLEDRLATIMRASEPSPANPDDQSALKRRMVDTASPTVKAINEHVEQLEATRNKISGILARLEA